MMWYTHTLLQVQADQQVTLTGCQQEPQSYRMLSHVIYELTSICDKNLLIIPHTLYIIWLRKHDNLRV